MSKETGGPAFPETKEQHAWNPGMTLRDYFAAKAMQSILDQNDVNNGRVLPNAAWIAYKMADTMLEARK